MEFKQGLEIVKKVALDHFGSNCSTYKRGDEYWLIVHYPEVIIKNSSELQHTIKDLYIITKFRNISGSIKVDTSLYGVRGSLTYAELNSNYGHSHLSGGQYSIDSFCLGTSEIYDCLIDVREDFSEDNLDFLFSYFDILASWESLEGVPFHRIENIKIKNQHNRNFLHDEDIKILAFRLIPWMKFEYIEGNYKFTTIDWDSIDQNLIDSLDSKYLEGISQNDYSEVYARNFVKITQEEIEESGPIFQYKNKDILCKIDEESIPKQEELTETNNKKRIKEELKSRIISKLENEYKRYRISKEFNRMETFWKTETVPIRELFTSGKLFASIDTN